jgi:dipeptidyl aminopeptidase/acylaminoacyl peptidase
MNLSTARLFLVIILFVFQSCGQKGGDTGLTKLPVEDFFRNPDRLAYKISPDGKYLAFLAPYQQRMNIFVQQVGDTVARRITAITDRDIPRFGWSGNQRLFFLKDIDGDENYYLSTVNIFDGEVKELTRFSGVRTEIVDELTARENTMLIGLNQRISSVFDIYELDLKSGDLKMILENPGNYSDFLTDDEGQLRLIVTTDGTTTGILYRESTSKPFTEVLSTNFKNTFYPKAFASDYPNEVYALTNIGRDKKAAVRFNLLTGIETEVLFEHDEFDADWLVISEHTGKPLLVQYTDWKSRYHFLDARVQLLHERVRKEIPDDEIVFTGSDENELLVVIRTYSDRTLGQYFLFDAAADSLHWLADVSPWLKKNQLAEVNPISYLTRDGLKIHGYLTIPRNVAPKKLPMIVVPHGGPWMRDVWRFDQNVQFLANRGYAVLQMNFRGSTGYGRAFWEAGFRQWGKAMQNDITDGVNFMIKQGVADPSRVAIYGGSYGGYAVLAGLAFTPDLYACGIDYVGVSNLFTLMQTIPAYWEQGREMFYEMIGHPQKDSLHYVEVSPVFHANKIKVPLMVIQGAQDPRVKRAESDQIVEALAARGVEVDYIIRDDEGHGFRKQENRIEMYRSIEAFLSRHLSN